MNKHFHFIFVEISSRSFSVFFRSHSDINKMLQRLETEKLHKHFAKLIENQI